MIDLHVHALPGVDDGPASLDDALVLAQRALDQDTSVLVATPHVSEAYPNTSANIEAGVDVLSAAVADADLDVRIVGGAEISIDRLSTLDNAELAALTLGSGPYLLIESPLSPSIGDFVAPLRSLRERGFNIVLAHPERAPVFQRDRAGAHAARCVGDTDLDNCRFARRPVRAHRAPDVVGDAARRARAQHRL